jgi:RNA polymerase sigma-70 factor (ECF subfamily)
VSRLQGVSHWLAHNDCTSMTGDVSLSELLNQARDGDDAARDLLFEKCRAYVNVVARARVESWMRAKVDASDLVQQTLLEAHRGLSNFQGTTEAEWLAWLRRILDHNAVDFIRQYRGTKKREIRKEVRLNNAASDVSQRRDLDPSAGMESPSELVMRRERDIEVAEVVSQLTDDHQEVIMLRNLQRLPFDEVARRMGRTRPAVQMLWMRALRKLETILQQ